MLDPEQEKPELSRRGFILNYPMFRYWNRSYIDQGLENLRAKPLNLYVHMPYCIQRCAYCYFKTTTLKENRLQQIDRYVDSVCQEIRATPERFHLGARPIETMYFGGGTPTLLSAENLEKLFTTLRENFNIDRPEITVEGEPVTLTERKAEVLERYGVNRISLGIQSFAEEVVFQTGRRDTEEQAMAAIQLAKSIGATVNIDLISGLAGERMETWAYSVKRAIESGADSITVYKLELYANTPYYGAEKNQEIHLPDDEEELEYFEYAMNELRANGFQPVNAFTFTRNGAYDQQHTKSKWHGGDNYAFGVSAFGSLGNWSYQNTNDINAYTELVERGEVAYQRAYIATSLDLMIRDVVLGIKLLHLSHRRFRERHGLDLLHLCKSTLQTLESEGFVTVDDEHISLTDLGLIYADSVGRTLEAAIKRFAGVSSGGKARVHFAEPKELANLGGRALPAQPSA